MYRNSQFVVGWTEDHFRYLDSIASINISFSATTSERSRYENNLTLGVNDQGPKPVPIEHRPDLSPALGTLAAIKHQEGKTNPYLPKHMRDQRPIEEREKLERQKHLCTVRTIISNTHIQKA